MAGLKIALRSVQRKRPTVKIGFSLSLFSFDATLERKHLLCKPQRSHLPRGWFEAQPVGQFEVPVQKTGEVERYLPKDGKPYLRTLCLKILLGLLSRRNSASPTPKLRMIGLSSEWFPALFPAAETNILAGGVGVGSVPGTSLIYKLMEFILYFRDLQPPGPRPIWNWATQAMGKPAYEAPLTRTLGVCAHV